MQLCNPNRLSFISSCMVHPGRMVLPLKFNFLFKCIPVTSAKNFSVKPEPFYRHAAFSFPEKQSAKPHINFHMAQRFNTETATNTAMKNISESKECDEKSFTNKTKIHLNEINYDKILTQYVEEALTFSAEKWNTVKEELCQEYAFFNKNNFDGIFMNICCRKENYPVGKAYMEYLEGTGTKINVAVLSSFLRLCYICYTECDEELILKAVNILKSRYKIFDADTAENIIQGLSLTSHWKECFDYFEMINITCKPSSKTYSAVVIAAFKNKHYDVGWEYLEKLISMERQPKEQVYHAWIEECQKTRVSELDTNRRGEVSVVQKSKTSDMMMEKFLHFLAEKQLYPNENVLYRISHWFESKPGEQWHGHHTTVSKSGICKFCQTQLEDIVLQQEDFNLMQGEMMKLALKRNDVFVNTTPEELKKFTRFLKKTAPYDVVLDGLNIGYIPSHKGALLGNAQLLYTVVKHFADQSMKVLLFGRKHMLRWSVEHMPYIRQHAYVFTIDNLSQDDPFLLYATMYSGLGTYFLSHDLFRNHLFILKNPELQRTFRLWQLKYQLKLQILSGLTNISIIYPAKCMPAAQQKENMWHIPFDDGIPQQGIQPPQNWLCLTRIPTMKKGHKN